MADMTLPPKLPSNDNGQVAKQIAKLAEGNVLGEAESSSELILNRFLMRTSAIQKPSGLGSEAAPSLPQVPPVTISSNNK